MTTTTLPPTSPRSSARPLVGPVVTVTPDPVLDHLWSVPHLNRGHHHDGARGTARAGGRGIDVSRILHGQGHETVTVTTAGGDTGAMLSADLASSGLPNRIITVSAPTRRALNIFTGDAAAATIFEEPGTTLTADEATVLAEATLRISDPALVAICGNIPLGFGAHGLADLITGLKAQGSLVVFDGNGPSLVTAARAGADVLTPNCHEIMTATGIDDPVQASRFLIEGGARVVMVSTVDGRILVTTDSDSVAAHLPRGRSCCDSPGAGAAAVASLCAHLVHAADAPTGALARRALIWSAASDRSPLDARVTDIHDLIAGEVVVTAA